LFTGVCTINQPNGRGWGTLASSPESKMETSSKASPLRVVAAACIILVGFCFMAGFYVVSVSQKGAANKDFVEYWAAGQQLVNGANPYDGAAILRLERTAGFDPDRPLVSFSPPVALVFVLPLGLVGEKTGFIAWSLVLLAVLSVSNWVLWMVNGRPDSRLHLLGYLFAPALACQLAGQLGTFFLAGVALFLCLHRSRPYLAGAALLPCTLKPHLFLALAIVLVLWMIDRKAYRVLAGFAAMLFASCALSLWFDIHAWTQYSQMMSVARPLNIFVPTLSMMFRLLIDRNAAWLQFIPEVCSCLWAIWFYWTQRARWSWTDQGLLLLLVSVACAPYAYFSDEAVLLPAVLAGVYRAVDSGRSLLPVALFAGVALIELLEVVKMNSPFYVWTAPAWLAWYLYATSARANSPKPRGMKTEKIHTVTNWSDCNG
jgi:hypothetical protein